MNISYIEKINKGKLCITLEDSDSFLVSEKEWERINGDCKDWIEDERLEELYEEIFLPKAKFKALNLLKSRDHTRAELIRKLKMAGYPEVVIKKTIDYNDHYHYLDDERFAENYILSRGRSKSKKELLYALSSKGVDCDYVKQSEVFNEICDDREAIRYLIEKKWGSHMLPDQKERDRMTRYLARRGFRAEDIFSVYKEKNI